MLSPSREPGRAQEKREAFYKNLHRWHAKRYRDCDSLAVQVILNLILTSTAVQAAASSCVQEAELTLPSFNTLSILRRCAPKGCPLNELSNLLLVTRANMTGVIDHLVKKGFVTRDDHPSDRRVVLARITPRGEAWLEAYLPKHFRLIGRLTEALSVSQKKQLVALLSRFRAQVICGGKGRN